MYVEHAGEGTGGGGGGGGESGEGWPWLKLNHLAVHCMYIPVDT